MIKALSLVAALVATANACTVGSNHTCLDLYLWDMFGDGWNGARLYVEYPDGHVMSDAPTCEYNPIYHQICTDTSGQFYMVNLWENGTIPDEYWEIFWTAKVDYCNGTDLWYTGGFNTTMVWDYDADSDTWTLVYWDNLWPNEDTCEACGDAKACKPKPKPKPKRKPKKKHRKHGGGGGGGEDEEVTNTTEEEEEEESSEMAGPKYGPPAVNVAVTMWDEEGNGWFQTDYHGANWYIYDSVRTHVFFSGTLCDGFNGQCRICLGDGSYVFRVTGEIDNFTSWDFCGVTGNYQNELTFHIWHGKCYPDVLRNVSQVCADQGSALVTVSGVIAVNGIPSELFDANDANVLFKTLGTEVSQWSSSSMSLVSSVLDSRSSLSSERKLSVYTHEVQFAINFDPATFGVDGLIYSNVKELVEDVKDMITEKIEDGEFLSELLREATILNVPMMASVQGVELLSLEVSSITYSGVLPFHYSTLRVQEEEAQYADEASYDVTSIVVFFSALAVGFVAFVGIMYKGMSGYKPLPQESVHGASVHGTAISEVMPTESEHPVTSRSNKFEVGRAEATI